MSALKDDNYNKLPDEVKNNDNINIQTNQNQNFDKIKNISELPHKYITQPKSNEFFILINGLKEFCMSLFILLISLCFLAAIICISLFSTDCDPIGRYIGLAFASFFFVLLLIANLSLIFNFFQSPKGIKITLDVDGIKMIEIYRCPCHNKQISETGEIKRFDVKTDIIKNDEETKKSIKSISIIYYDHNNNEKLLAKENFDENEANYLIYILNNYLQSNTSNYITPITPYNNY